MKTRLPKMLLAAVLAAMTSAYASVIVESGHQYYQGGSSGDPIVITDAADFGSGIPGATSSSTVNIGYGNDGGVAYDATFTLSGDDFATPNALFIGGPGWPHTLREGYEAAEGDLTLDSGATLTVASNVLMGTCVGAESYLHVQGGSELHAVNMQVSNGGGSAAVFVGDDNGSTGSIRLDGNLAIGLNAPDPSSIGGRVTIFYGSRVDVAGSTSLGYATETAPGSAGWLNLYGTLNTASLEIGIGTKADGTTASQGMVGVAGTLNVTGSEHETLIGINGGYGILGIVDGGTANLGSADVRVGATSEYKDYTEASKIEVQGGGTLNHDGTMYVGDRGTVSEETGMPNYGVGQLSIAKGATANLNGVEVSEDSRILVDGTLTVDETPDKYGIQGVRLYNGAILAGSPDNQGGKLTFSVVPEDRQGTEVVINNFTLTAGTTLKAACDTHLTVGGGKTLTFDKGTLWLTDGIAYINEAAWYDAGTITTTAGSGNISVAGNGNLKNYLDSMGSERSGSKDMVALIDVGNFLDNGGTVTGILSESGALALDRAGYEVRFTDKAVTVLNDEYDVDDFRGFYVVKTTNAEDAYPTFDRNQREVYDVIKQLDESGLPIPEELKDVINTVLNMDGINQAAEIRDVLDFLGAVNYSVMMHNQIDANTSHQRMLRNRSMAGRNLRHNKGCTDVYAAGFYDGQRLNGSRSKGEGYHRTEWGGLVGADTCINDNLRIGADLAYGRARINPSHNWSMHQDSFYWDVYAQLRKGNWRSITALGMGIHSFDLKRGIGAAMAKANNVKGYSFNFTEEVSYDWKVNEKTTIQPFAALDLNWNTIKAFTDGDLGALNIHVKKQDALAADLTLGGRYIRDFALLTNVPDATWYAQLGVVVSMGKTDCDMDCNFVGTPDSVITVKAAERDRVGLDLGTGITIPVKDNWAIFANGEAILRGDSHNINAQIGVQVAF